MSLDVLVNEAWLGVHSDIGRGLPLQKLMDQAEAALSYDLRLWRVVGPYVRAHARASLFETMYYPDGPRSIDDRSASPERRPSTSPRATRFACSARSNRSYCNNERV